jgi:hypothetical protein
MQFQKSIDLRIVLNTERREREKIPPTPSNGETFSRAASNGEHHAKDPTNQVARMVGRKTR